MYKLVVTTIRGQVHYSRAFTIENTGGSAIDTRQKVRETIESIVALAPERGVIMKNAEEKTVSFPATGIESCSYVEAG